ncbi:hypothetical protein Y032_0038g3585 [Ancylostoma ceylanicum]|uniref:Uncharacterized protein n=1 Tax=Ancylostoma ceylanicum TaxID=53326 RepID=A0A016UI42_9BILA|nr:hypothetical protein Y032_0038g3585 [Ancylostoma ceylanicum]
MEFLWACTGSRKSSGQIARDTGSVTAVGSIILRSSMYSPSREDKRIARAVVWCCSCRIGRDLLDSPTWSILSSPLSPRSRNGFAASESVYLFEKECTIGHSLTTAFACS